MLHDNEKVRKVCFFSNGYCGNAGNCRNCENVGERRKLLKCCKCSNVVNYHENWDNNYAREKGKNYLIIWEGSVFVDGIDLRDFGANGFALEHSFLLALGEQRDLVVHIFQHYVDGGFRGKLLGAVVLELN